MVADENVVLISDPEACWSGVSVEECPRCMHLNGNVVVIVIVCLNSILNEECVAHCIVSNVVHNAKIVDVMGSHGSVVSFVD
jgi:hypothetical protein